VHRSGSVIRRISTASLRAASAFRLAAFVEDDEFHDA
jgi:hypothetical protein